MNVSPECIATLMGEALEEASRGLALGEVPVGAVVSVDGQIIARAHNETEARADATAHAEVLAIQRASAAIANWRLSSAILCVTLEPCTMCCGAISLARIPVVAFGAPDPRLGAMGSLYAPPHLEDHIRILRGVRAEEGAKLLSSFFQARRTPLS